jgi:hypothetical protein
LHIRSAAVKENIMAKFSLIILNLAIAEDQQSFNTSDILSPMKESLVPTESEVARAPEVVWTAVKGIPIHPVHNLCKPL